MKPLVLATALILLAGMAIGGFLLWDDPDPSLKLQSTPNSPDTSARNAPAPMPDTSSAAKPNRKRTEPPKPTEDETPAAADAAAKSEEAATSPTANATSTRPAPTLRREGESEADRKMREITASLNQRAALPLTSETPPPEGYTRRPAIGASDANGGSAFRPLRQGHSYREGDFNRQAQASDDFTREVVGEVFEVRNGVRFPLADVMINDFQARRRSFSDSRGRFTMRAYYRDTLAQSTGSRDDKADNDAIYLLASADGYEMALAKTQGENNSGVRARDGLWFFAEQLESRVDGSVVVPIEMRWVGTEQVRVKLVNPPEDPTAITITVEATDPGSTWADQPFFASTLASPKGDAIFDVSPRRMLHIRAKGKGFTEKAGGVVFDKSAGMWMVELQSASLTWISGRVTDLRTRLPISGARLSVGDDHYGVNGVAYTDAEGNYAGWFDIQNSRAMLAQHTSYARTSGTLPSDATSLDFTLRPLVKWSGRILMDNGSDPQGFDSAFFQEAGGFQVIIPLGRDSRGLTLLDTQGLPWGATTIDFYILSPPPNPPSQFRITFEGVGWDDRNAYSGDVRARKVGG